MASIPPSSPTVIGGIDTHKDLHVAAVMDAAGTVLGTESFSTTRAGYRALIRWMRSYGDVRLVGVEGTGSYGAGVTRQLTEAGIEVLEVDRPDRSHRRLRGSPTPWTPRPRPGPPWPATGPAHPRPTTAWWSRCGCCG
jgi:transposase